MTSVADQAGTSDLGESWNARFEAAAIGRLEEVSQDDELLARWAQQLIRAIQKHRLRVPTLSPTVHRIVEIIESPEVDLDDLADAVSGDPTLATRIMGVANSSFFRGATAVVNVREALMRMGVREARTIVVVVALRATVLRSSSHGPAAAALWRHSLLTAAATQEVTAELPAWETAGFLAGLVHDIGQLVIFAFVSELAEVRDDFEDAGDDLIAALSNTCHAELGALVLASWRFPEPFCEAVAAHHDPESTESATRDLARAIRLGHRVAHQIDAGWPQEAADLAGGVTESGQLLGLDADRLTDIAMEAEANFEALDKLG